MNNQRIKAIKARLQVIKKNNNYQIRSQGQSSLIKYYSYKRIVNVVRLLSIGHLIKDVFRKKLFYEVKMTNVVKIMLVIKSIWYKLKCSVRKENDYFPCEWEVIASLYGLFENIYENYCRELFKHELKVTNPLIYAFSVYLKAVAKHNSKSRSRILRGNAHYNCDFKPTNNIYEYICRICFLAFNHSISSGKLQYSLALLGETEKNKLSRDLVYIERSSGGINYYVLNNHDNSILLGFISYRDLSNKFPVNWKTLDEITDFSQQIIGIVVANGHIKIPSVNFYRPLISGKEIVMPLIYLLRWQHESEYNIIHDFNIHQLFIVSIIVTCKFYFDSFNVCNANSYFSERFSMPLSHINKLEKHFLQDIRYNLYCSQSQIDAQFSALTGYSRWYKSPSNN